MRRWVKILLYVIIASVVVLALLGFISTWINDISAFWSGPIPLFHDTLGIIVSNLDIATMGMPICGICIMLLYIDIRRRHSPKMH